MPHKPKAASSQSDRRAALIRVSTDEQATEGYSPEVQLARIQAFAQDQFGAPVAEGDVFYELGVSGHTGELRKRPGLQRLLAACEAGTYSHVIVHKLDRLGRNVKLMSTALEKFADHGVLFTSVHDKIDGTTAAGKLFISIFCAVAQWYSDNLSDEVKKGHEGRRRAGRINGTAPYGAMKDPITRLSVPDTRPITLRDGRPGTPYEGLLHLMERSAQGHSPLAVTTWLIEQGYTALHGARFTRTVVRKARENRFYLGEISDGNGGWLPGKHAPLIPLELFERVQAAIARNQMQPPSMPKGSHPHPLGAGLLRCVSCYEQGFNSALNGSTKGGKRAYGCQGRHARNSCREPYTKASKLEDQVAWLLGQVAFASADAERVVTLYEGLARAEHPQPDYRAQAKVLNGRMDRLRQMYEWGDIEREVYQARQRELRLELAQLAAAQEAAPSVEKMLDIRLMVQSAAEAWNEAEDAERRDIARLFFEKIWVKDQQIVGIEPQEGVRELLRVLEGQWSTGVTRSQPPYSLPKTVLRVVTPSCKAIPSYNHYPTGKRLKPETRAAIVTLRGQGLTYLAICQQLHISSATISLVLHEGGVR